MKLIILICTIVSQPFSWTILSGDDLVSRKYIYLFILNLSPIPHPDPSHNLAPFDVYLVPSLESARSTLRTQMHPIHVLLFPLSVSPQATSLLAKLAGFQSYDPKFPW